MKVDLLLELEKVVVAGNRITDTGREALVVTQLQWVTLVAMYYNEIIEQEKQLISTNELLFAHAETVLANTPEQELRQKYNAQASGEGTATIDNLSKMASRDIAIVFLKSLVVLDEIDVR